MFRTAVLSASIASAVLLAAIAAGQQGQQQTAENAPLEVNAQLEDKEISVLAETLRSRFLARECKPLESQETQARIAWVDPCDTTIDAGQGTDITMGVAASAAQNAPRPQLFVAMLFVRDLRTGNLIQQSASSLLVPPGLGDCTVHVMRAPSNAGRYRVTGVIDRLLREDGSMSEWVREAVKSCTLTVK